MKTTVLIIKIIAYTYNIYFLMLGIAMFKVAPLSSLAASLICGVLDIIFYNILLRIRYNRPEYKKAPFSDRCLIKTMFVAMLVGPWVLSGSISTFFGFIFIIVLFFPTRKHIDLLLKCDDYHLAMKDK